MNSKFSVNDLSDQIHGVYHSLKTQMSDALAVYEGKHDVCENDLKHLAGGLNQANADAHKFTELNLMDANTLASRNDELDDKQEALAGR